MVVKIHITDSNKLSLAINNYFSSCHHPINMHLNLLLVSKIRKLAYYYATFANN